MSGEGGVPRFRRGVKFRFDATRQAWVLLAPERLFQPDETAAEILKLVDGARSLGGIADDLALRFDAPRGVIAADVIATLDDLAARGVLEIGG